MDPTTVTGIIFRIMAINCSLAVMSLYFLDSKLRYSDCCVRSATEQQDCEMSQGGLANTRTTVCGRLTFEFCPPVKHLRDVSRHDPLNIMEVVLQPLQILLGPGVDVELLGLFYKLIEVIHRADELVGPRCCLHLAPILVMKFGCDFRQKRHR